MAVIECAYADAGGLADLAYGGTGTLSGTVKVGATPVSRRVRLFDYQSGHLIRAAWSGEDGAYSFECLATGRDFLALADDYTQTYNDVVAARVRAV
jgi:hypothetical protein